MPRQSRPDGVMDIDRGTSNSPMAKRPAWMSPVVAEGREEVRYSHRELDGYIESDPGATRAAKDSALTTPRDADAPLGHPRKARTLPAPDSVRVPLSSRQRKDRSRAKLDTQDAMPRSEYDAMRTVMVQDSEQWRRLNDHLSEAAGDIHDDAVPDEVRRTGQRLDRAIQRYERRNDRGHVVYSHVRMRHYINAGNVAGYVGNNFTPGQVITFDRYTGATHCMHELDEVAAPEERDRHVVLEMQTRRGMYLGRSDSLDDTRHLLPRGVQMEVVSAHQAQYRRPDGTTGRRTVVQLVDVSDTE